MPFKSKKQENFMRMIASGKKPTKKGGVGPSPELAERFLKHQSPKNKKK